MLQNEFLTSCNVINSTIISKKIHSALAALADANAFSPLSLSLMVFVLF
jgi:hypothetical protein